MSSHLSTIGLPVDDHEAFAAVVDELLPRAESIPAGRGRYLRWRDPSGAELWLQLDARGTIQGFQPHFHGRSRMQVGLTARIPGDGALEGALHGWAAPTDADPESGMYPFVFDAPDYGLHRDVRLPSVAELQLAAFAHEVALFDSEAAYDAGEDDGPRMAVRSFIPSGLFGEAQEATAIFTGVVGETERRTNQHTGAAFYWAEVDTLDARVDVVIDPDLLDRPPRPGDVLQGSFWLSGRLVHYERRPASWWRRLVPGGNG